MGSKENKNRWRWNNPENDPKAEKEAASGTKAKREKSNKRLVLL